MKITKNGTDYETYKENIIIVGFPSSSIRETKHFLNERESYIKTIEILLEKTKGVLITQEMGGPEQLYYESIYSILKNFYSKI